MMLMVMEGEKVARYIGDAAALGAHILCGDNLLLPLPGLPQIRRQL